MVTFNGVSVPALQDHMWQHRQEERALKRAEMDAVKQRKNLEDTMRKLNTGMYLHTLQDFIPPSVLFASELSKRQEEEAEQLTTKEDGLVVYQQNTLHEKGSNVKEHTKMALAGRQRLNEQTKKFMKKE